MSEKINKELAEKIMDLFGSSGFIAMTDSAYYSSGAYDELTRNIIRILSNYKIE